MHLQRQAILHVAIRVQSLGPQRQQPLYVLQTNTYHLQHVILPNGLRSTLMEMSVDGINLPNLFGSCARMLDDCFAIFHEVTHCWQR